MSILALLLLFGLPILEIYLFVLVGGEVGALATILLCLLTAALGMGLMRKQGLSVLLEARALQAQGKVPVAEAAHGFLIVMAGVLLLAPGFFTDGLGFLLLWRGFRLFVILTFLEAAMASFFVVSPPNPSHNRDEKQDKPDPKAPPKTPPKTIEGDYWSSDDKQPKP